MISGLIVTALSLAGAAFCYGNKAKWLTLQIFVVYLGWGVYVAHGLMYEASPAAFWAVTAVGAGLSLVLIAIVTADARFGLFSLNTFFGIIFIVALAPVMLVVNTIVLLYETVVS